MTAANTFFGYIVRRYDCHEDMMDFATIESEIYNSLEEVADEIIDFLKNSMKEMSEPPLSRKEWAATRKQLIDSGIVDGQNIAFKEFKSLKGYTMPADVRVDKVRLSDKLVEQIRNTFLKEACHDENTKEKIDG
jgi:hypothetical protein